MMVQVLIILCGLVVLGAGLRAGLFTLIILFFPRQDPLPLTAQELLMTLGFVVGTLWLFAAAFGVMFRKNWARIGVLVSSGVGLVAGWYWNYHLIANYVSDKYRTYPDEILTNEVYYILTPLFLLGFFSWRPVKALFGVPSQGEGPFAPIKNNAFILLFGICLLPAVWSLGVSKAREGDPRPDYSYVNSITREDQIQLFEMILRDNPDTCCGTTNEPILYVLQNNYVDQTIYLRHPTRTVRVVSQAELDQLRKANPLVGFIVFTDVHFVSREWFKGRMASVDYSANWYGGERVNGYCDFTRENGRWINQGSIAPKWPLRKDNQ